MKYNKISNKIMTGVMALAALGTTASCGDAFLDEDAGHLVSDGLLETPEGALSMAAGLYGNIRWHFGYEWAYGTTLYGTDEFTSANDLTSEPWNTYDNRLNPLDCTTANGAANANCPGVSGLWNQMYYGISTANLVLSRVGGVADTDARNKAMGEAYFLRGYNYYRLFAQYGGVVLQTEPAKGVQKHFTRATEDETLAQIISDFDNAYKVLPDTKWRGNGTWTKYTAAHFLAKALLYRQSERCAAWNGKYDKAADLNRCAELCKEVIAACPLEADYNNLYNNWTGVDCPIEGSKEILMAAEFNEDNSTQGRFGNRSYNYFAPQYANFSGGWVQRGQFIGSMEFQRCRPTEYTYAIFDNVNDARMWKTFRTVYGLNAQAEAPAGVASKNGINEEDVPALDVKNLGNFDNQLKGVAFLLNNKGYSGFKANGTLGKAADPHTFIDPETGKWIPNVFAVYTDGQYTMDTYNIDRAHCNVYCGVNKVEDGSRTGEKGDAHRDVIMARSGETYLVLAEALVRLGQDGEALKWINDLRKRGQWHDGEDRSKFLSGDEAFKNNSTSGATTVKKNKDVNGNVLNNLQAWYASYYQTNTYYLSTGIAPTTAASSLQIASWDQIPVEDKAVLDKMGTDISTMTGKINFIMNERTRELLGEWNRWDELSRTGLLITRTKAFNNEARNGITAGKHEYRPIPQTFIDILQDENGQNLSAAEKKKWQNPGY